MKSSQNGSVQVPTFEFYGQAIVDYSLLVFPSLEELGLTFWFSKFVVKKQGIYGIYWYPSQYLGHEMDEAFAFAYKPGFAAQVTVIHVAQNEIDLTGFRPAISLSEGWNAED